MHSDQEDTVVIHKSVIYTVLYLHVQRGHQKWNQKSATVECGVKSKQLSMAWRSASADTADWQHTET